MLKEFIKYYKPYKLLFISDMLASFLISLSAMVYPIITRNMLNDFIPNSKYDRYFNTCKSIKCSKVA